MQTSLAGSRSNAGITLIEMLVVVTIVGILAGISFPTATAGLDNLRLTSACNTITSFLNAALTRAERRDTGVEVIIIPEQSALEMRSADGGTFRRIQLAEGVTITAIYPQLALPAGTARRFILYPDGVVPAIAVHLQNRRGEQRVVSVDPLSGVPRVLRPETQ